MVNFFKGRQNKDEATKKKDSKIISLEEADKALKEKKGKVASYGESVYAIRDAIKDYCEGERYFPMMLYNSMNKKLYNLDEKAMQEAEEKGYCFFNDKYSGLQMIDVKR